MTTASAQGRTGGQVIIDLLRRNGVDRVFTVPGESFLPVLDADRMTIRELPLRCFWPAARLLKQSTYWVKMVSSKS